MNSDQPVGETFSSKDEGEVTSDIELLAEFPALPEKFFSFTHEGISQIWMHESPARPIRGIRQSTSDSPKAGK